MERKSAKQIIEALAKDVKVKDACRKIGGTGWEDLYQDLFIVICQQPDDRIEEIEEKKYLQFWIVRTLMNLQHDVNRYNSKNVLLNEGEGEKIGEGEIEEEQKFIRQREIVGSILREIERGGREKGAWYKVNLFRLYSEVKNYSEISRLTGIPFVTVKRDVLNFKRELATIIDKRT